MQTKVLRLNERQKLFFMARRRFIGYGGARGGGKTWSVRMKAMLLASRYAGIKILIVRRSFQELRDNHILPLQMELRDIARWKEQEKRFIFPNGSYIRFGYCSAERDVLQYQGQEFDIIFIDEATQLTEFQFQTFKGCLRGANDFPKRMYLTCNPGGVGHAWVKRLFVDRQYRGDERADDYEFIQAKVTDNPVLMEKDPEYQAWVKANCESPCPDGERKTDFSDRICRTVAELIDKALAAGEERLVILAHGGTQMAAMERFAVPHRDYYAWCGPNAGGFVLDAKDWTEKHLLYLVKTVQYTKESRA